MDGDKISGAIRMLAAYLAGGFWAWMAGSLSIEPTTEIQELLVHSLVGLFSVVHYLGVRLLSRWLPWVEYLLFIPRSPVYVRSVDYNKSRDLYQRLKKNGRT